MKYVPAKLEYRLINERPANKHKAIAISKKRIPEAIGERFVSNDCNSYIESTIRIPVSIANHRFPARMQPIIRAT